MSRLKKLMGQTAIYGVTNIASRFVNFLLTPLLTGVLDPDSFGIQSALYVYIAFLLALLTWGMETSVFRFSVQYPNNEKVFPTAFSFVAALSLLFMGLAITFASPIASLLKYPGRGDFVVYFSLIIVLDALSAVPLAKLRQLNRPLWFSAANLLSIVANFLLVYFFLVYCRNRYMELGSDAGWLVNTVYNHDIGVGYVFIANIVASAIKFLAVLPIVLKRGIGYDQALLREMLLYSSPLAVAGICYIINERADHILLKYMSPEAEADSVVGLYSAVYKMAILMNIFIQAFRFAAEPFFFSLEKDADSRQVYARVLNYFTVFCLLIFLLVALFADFFKLILLRDPQYWEAMFIVPILLMAYLFSGIYQNLSMWYKLSGRTQFGMWFSILGAGLTIGLNVLLIPHFGYEGCAWATLACYFIMSAVSYVVGQRYYPIPYEPLKIGFYILVAVCIYGVNLIIPKYSVAMQVLTGLASMALFLVIFVRNEKDIQTLILRYYAKRKR